MPIYWGSKPEDLVGERAVAVGDAAGLVNFVGEGICYALASARAAAESLSKLLEEDRLSKRDILAEYGPRLEREALAELRVTPTLELALRRLPRTIAKLLREDGEARELMAKLIEHSIDAREGYERMKKKLLSLKYLGAALLELTRLSTI